MIFDSLRGRSQDRAGGCLRANLGRHRSAGVCPDCDADAELSEPSPGVFVLEIRHDDSCPWLAARETRR